MGMADRVEVLDLRHKAQEEATGGPLGDEGYDVVRAQDLSPSGRGARRVSFRAEGIRRGGRPGFPANSPLD